MEPKRRALRIVTWSDQIAFGGLNDWQGQSSADAHSRERIGQILRWEEEQPLGVNMRETRQVRNAPHGFRGSIPAERHVPAPFGAEVECVETRPAEELRVRGEGTSFVLEASRCQATRLALARGFADVSATTAPNGSRNIAPASSLPIRAAGPSGVAPL